MIYIYYMILVTGGTGLVGTHLLYDLAQKGEPVRALYREERSLEEVKKVFAFYSGSWNDLFTKIQWVKGDLLDGFSISEAMEGITKVYHCAAIVSLNPSDGHRMILNNVTGTATLVNLALEKKVQKFCYVSSVAALGIEKDREITEDTAWNDESNGSAYAISKYLSENEVWRGSQEGLNVVVINPTIVIGPCNPHRSSGLIFKTASKGYRWYTEGGMAYVDARDVATAMVKLMDNGITNQRMIVSSENLSYRKFTELLYDSLGMPLPNKKAGKAVLGLAWRLDKLRSRLTGADHVFTREVARYASVTLQYSNAKIKKQLGMEFIPVGRALQEAAKYFNSSLKGG